MNNNKSLWRANSKQILDAVVRVALTHLRTLTYCVQKRGLRMEGAAMRFQADPRSKGLLAAAAATILFTGRQATVLAHFEDW